MEAQDDRTKLPTAIDNEDPFLIIGGFQISLRQILTILIGVMVWYGMAKLMEFMGLSIIFGLLIWSWTLIIALVMALVPKDGRPYEEYLSKKIIFLLSPRYYILKNPRSDNFSGGVEDADWKEIEL